MKPIKKNLSSGECRLLRSELACFLRKKGLSADDSDDIIQDTILKYLTCTADICETKSRHYIQKIASNTYKDHLRERAKRVYLSDEHDTIPELDSMQDTLHKMNTEILSSILQGDLGQSQAGQAFKQFYLEGKKLHEIASDFGLPLSTIGSWVKRTRDKSAVGIKRKFNEMDLEFVGNQPILFQ